MNCKEFDDKISLYIDKKLNSDEEKIFLDHSKHCQRCHVALENTGRMLDSLQDLNHIRAPKDLSKSIIEALKMEEMNLANGNSPVDLENITEKNVQEDQHYSVRKTGQLESHRKSRSGRFLKQMSWIKKVSLAAALVLIVTSAVILSNNWLPSPIQDDMMVMESGEESTLDQRAADESEPGPESLENGEAQDSGEDIGITASEEGEGEFEDEAGTSEDLDGETLDEDDAADSYGESVEDSEVDTFGIKYGEWIVLLLGIGVISVIVVLRKNRKN